MGRVRLLRSRRLKVVRVGGEESVDIRIIAATNRRPTGRRAGKGMLYRLGVFPIHCRRWRPRQSVARRALSAERTASDGTSKRFTREALAHLRHHGWPGNVRELKNAVHRATILADADIEPEHLPLAQAPTPEYGPDAMMRVAIGSTVADVERRLILATLADQGGNKERAARTLGISLKTLYNKLKKYRAA
jgi:DNA-binding NtrC family response regulator